MEEEKWFRAPEPEDNELPASEVDAAPSSAATPEDNDLPAEAYIDHAAALFNFSGPPERPRERTDPATRVVGGASAVASDGTAPVGSGGRSAAASGGSAAGSGTGAPTPPWLAEREREAHAAVPDIPGEAPAAMAHNISVDGKAPAAPDPALMPEETEPDAESAPADRPKLYKRLALALAAAVVVLLGVVVLVLYKGGWLPLKGVEPVVVYDQPQTAAEIADFYKTAVEIARKDGAGFRKKAWQTVSEMNLTGIAFVDDLLSGVFEEYFTPENAAKTEKYDKGSAEAGRQLPAFTLKDYSYIQSAECDAVGNNYQLTIVFRHEDTPVAGDSFLAGVTDTVFLWDKQIKPILDEISQLKAYEDVHVDYADVTIAAEITNTGRFVSMTHTAPAEVTVGSARLSIFTFSDKSFHFESVAQYRDFSY